MQHRLTLERFAAHREHLLSPAAHCAKVVALRYNFGKRDKSFRPPTAQADPLSNQATGSEAPIAAALVAADVPETTAARG